MKLALLKGASVRQDTRKQVMMIGTMDGKSNLKRFEWFNPLQTAAERTRCRCRRDTV